MRVIFTKQFHLQFYVFPALAAATLLLLSYRIGNHISAAQQHSTYTNHASVTAAPSICQISADENVVECGTSTTLHVDNGITNPIWSTGDTSSSITVTTSGQYWWQYIDTSRNTVTNGDFSNGRNGFTSQYNYISPNGSTGSFGALSAEGYYTVSSNPRNTHTQFSSFHDHTNGAGKMMVVNGSPQNNVTVWAQDITVEPHTSYLFSIWGASAHPANPAKLTFSINGSLLGTIQFSATPGNWQNFTVEWTSGSSTTASIGIVNQNTIANGNDFALDDIVFAPVCRKYFNVSLYPNPPKPAITFL